MKTHLIIGSRGSKLALWQAEWTSAKLRALYPQIEIRIEVIKTTGDADTHSPLALIGGKGVFTKELEDALLAKRIDLAVHSLKDLPTILPEGLVIAAITEREDARDALVLRPDFHVRHPSIATLPQGSIVGTSSLRRLAQLKRLRPDIGIKDLRGNVDTRLRKLDAGEYDAVLLAAAGLRRLGFTNRISAAISLEEMLPAVGQGALGIETRADDEETISLLAALVHYPTREACMAERAFLRSLGGGCQLPIAAHAVVHQERLELDGLVAGLSGETIVRDKIEGQALDAVRLGETLGQRLLERGAASLLDLRVSPSDRALLES
ncbi:MAG TPA: hydroxymethylbilane synthase [Pyrinomonadaceae bacterium]|jgi:hydroxymethylbilane synthase